MPNGNHQHTALEDYFTALDAGRFEDALATLSDSCVYIRPPVSSVEGPPSTSLEVHVGKESVRAFLEKRGRLSLTHEIHASSNDGGQCFVMGTARSPTPASADRSIFMAHALLDDAGRIIRFLAMSTGLDAIAATWFTPPS